MTEQTRVGKLYGVVTSIQDPTIATRQLAQRIQQVGGRLIIIGDRKSPSSYKLSGAEFFSLRQQLSLDVELSRLLPTGHYCRKNLGYLLAIKADASPIYETDDDNEPLPTWGLRLERVSAVGAPKTKWLNAYRHFSTKRIWPRGFPLDELTASCTFYDSSRERTSECVAPIQQGLANGSPDVDAVWRLVLDQTFEFENKPSLQVSQGSWCPFNSQSTWWWPEAYPLMYLPSHCSFRMTDIWRSFIAQRCLWELGYGLVFHAPEVNQERNKHDLMKDFADEVVGHVRNKEMVDVLVGLTLKPGPGNQSANFRTCYEALVERAFFPEEELKLVDAWLSDLQGMGHV